MGAQGLGQVSRAAALGLTVSVMALAAVTPVAGGSPNPGLIKDIRANGSSHPLHLTAVGGWLYFTAATGKKGRELWKSDGTAANTVMVQNIRPGKASSSPDLLTDVAGALYFTADDGTHGRELWTSDGTAAGTRMVEDINTGSEGSEPESLTALGNRLFFVAEDGNTGRELWTSNGTVRGTKRVRDILVGAESSIPPEREIVAVGNRVYFSAFESPPQGFTFDVDLWKSDGTASGTKRVKDLPAGSPGAGPYELTDVDNMLFFACSCDDSYGRLWISNGTPTGTHEVVSGNPHPKPANPDELTDVNGTLFFGGFDDFGAGEGIWRSDGTSAGTEFLGDPSGPSAQIQPQHLTAVGSRLFFDVINGFDIDLWTSDGTVDGTVFLQASVNLNTHAVVGSWIYYEHAGELWYSDGMATTLAADIPDSTGPTPGMANVGGSIFFTADDGNHGTELWRYVP